MKRKGVPSFIDLTLDDDHAIEVDEADKTLVDRQSPLIAQSSKARLTGFASVAPADSDDAADDLELEAMLLPGEDGDSSMDLGTSSDLDYDSGSSMDIETPDDSESDTESTNDDNSDDGPTLLVFA